MNENDINKSKKSKCINTIVSKIETQNKSIEKIVTILDENTEHFQMIKDEIRRHEILSDPELIKMTRANTIVISTENKPVYTQTNSIDFVERVSELYNLYSVATGSQTIAANGFFVVQLTIPANTAKTIYINTLSAGAINNTTIDLLKNASFSATGTALTPINRNWASSNTSSMTSKYLSQSTDPTTGGSLLTSIIQTGGPVVLEFGGQFIIPSSTSARQFYIRLVNNAATTNLLSTNITWWEFPSSQLI